MFIYQTCPIDLFKGATTVDEYLKKIITLDPQEMGEMPSLYEFVTLAMECSYRVAKAKGSYWEGDIRPGDFYVFQIPDPERISMLLGLVWKQDNNGTTFICSPIELSNIPREELIFQN